MRNRPIKNTAASVRQRLLLAVPESFPEVWRLNMAFLQPVADAVQSKRPFEMFWRPAGPWRPQD